MKLRFTEQTTREVEFAPAFYRADAHAANPGEWRVQVGGHDYAVSDALAAADVTRLAALLDTLAQHVVTDRGGEILPEPPPRPEPEPELAPNRGGPQ